MAIRIGTSGWVYKHWRGVFYPETLRQRDWFGYYAHAFDTVEINNSFYRLPSADAFDQWRRQAPPGFLYAVKASRFLTHLKKLKDPEEPLYRFFERAARLGATLGPVLYQLPPRWQVDLPRFEQFLAALPQGTLHVIEFRDASWLIEEVFRRMERHQVSHCIHDMSPLNVPLRATASPVYLRFHGGPDHGGHYPLAALEAWARQIDDWREQGLDLFAYFNNDIGGYALENAKMLKRLLGIDERG
ncbi:MAG: DUF72 domain-containing protein [Candidatus Tectomicrobia bacterium]|uniref:DUF72 domain-containing protein n=1 Tax=Tectimicrobiota bacterium TaxID=2528274 RepID=A0A932CMR5_UNCTE|nr:DUF72 domain-containing protein [Candidatus Tectomicrobia bacterium]